MWALNEEMGLGCILVCSGEVLPMHVVEVTAQLAKVSSLSEPWQNKLTVGHSVRFQH